MAWNQTTGPSKPAAKKGPSVVHGLVAGVAVAAIGVAAFFLLSGDKVETKAEPEKKAGQIKEVTPAAAPKVSVEETPVEPAPKKEPTLREQSRKMTPEQKDALIEKSLAETPIPEESTNRLFRTGLEQVIGWVFTTELGDAPPPMPNLSDYDLVHIEEILNLQNQVKETDDEKSAETKTIVDNVKKELKKYLEKGGSPEEFLGYYHSELEQAYLERKMAQEEVVKVIRTEPELAIEYLDKVNASLKEKGIKGVVINERVFRRHGLYNPNGGNRK